MELNEKRKTVLAQFMRQMGAIKINASELQATKDKVNMVFADGTRVLLYLNSVKGGFGKGEFGIYIGLMMHNGLIYRILKDARLEGGSSFPKDMILRATSHSFKTGRGLYSFRTGSDLETTVKKMVQDVHRIFIPIIEQFTTKYEEGVNFILEHNGQHVRKPFAMCVVLIGLANRLDRVDEVVSRAKQAAGFWDFHRAKDCGKSAVLRVSAWFEKHTKNQQRKL
jgi:hypothetical protein